MTRRHWALSCLVACLLAALAPTLAPGAGVDRGEPMAPGATDEPDAEPPRVEPTDEAREAARQTRRELRELARAWADGGGTFGYPFWDTAGQRWRSRQVTTAMYREYVTGYRDRLQAGCELLDAVEAEMDAAAEVRSLLLDACGTRVDALRDQQRWLDALIERAATPADEADGEDRAALDERIAELEASWREQLQESLRDARLAMDQAQAELDETGLERLPEDAFI